MKNAEIGERIRNLRHQQHITQMQIYKACGISSGNLSSIENGKILPSSSALMQLSQALHCTTDYILFGESAAFEGRKTAWSAGETSAVPGLPLSQTEETLLSVYRRLSVHDQEELLMLARWKEKHDPRIKNAT